MAAVQPGPWLRALMKNSALPDDGVTAPKHVGVLLMLILMYILKLFLRQFTCASVGELKKNFDSVPSS
jgi:hypothetical protein